MNVVMTEHGGLIEVQATAEGQALSPKEFTQLLNLATQAQAQLTKLQREALGLVETVA